jgi:CRISPR-associated endonuclease/helicase Cas3
MERFHDSSFTFSAFKRDDLKEVLRTAVLFHDFGKATPWFQDYITDPDREGVSTDQRRLRRHGLISAVMTFGILAKKFGENLIYPALGFTIVRRHHGNLMDWRAMFTLTDDDLALCREQADHIDYDEYRQIVRTHGFSDWVDIRFLRQIIDEIEKGQYSRLRKVRRLNRHFTIEHYFVLTLLYSLLLSGDKQDAILQDNARYAGPDLLEAKHVSNYKERLSASRKNPILDIRNEIFKTVEQSVDCLDDGQRILSINAPTGSGKTITALHAALKISEKFRHDHIIYCLPFTAIIDQNFDVFEEIHEKSGILADSGALLKHHHLADIRYQVVEDDQAAKEYSANEALHLIEGWESHIVVTTFVQFLYSLISNRNSSLRKFNKFCNAVIILDEVQTIPHKYWKLVHDMLDQMVQRFNSRIVFVTATMPLIFSEKKGEIIELVGNKENIFSGLSRIDLDVSRIRGQNGQTVSIKWSQFCRDMIRLVEDNNHRDILIVTNTIRSCKELFHFLKEEVVTHELVYLSSHIIPKRRLEIVRRLKEKGTKTKPRLLVSTQLVEAGVDIDFDIVVRDMAPLDCIFQASGRCNRNCRSGVRGKVLLYSIEDSNGYEPARIYDKFLRDKTWKVLDGCNTIPESEFLTLATRYFQEVADFGSQQVSLEIIQKLSQLKLDREVFTKDFRLIDNDYSDSVFVEMDDYANRVWNQYQEILEWDGSFGKNVELKKIKRQLANYIINVPKRCLPDDHDEAIYRLKSNLVENYYDAVTGFRVEKQLPPEKSSVFF